MAPTFVVLEILLAVHSVKLHLNFATNNHFSLQLKRGAAMTTLDVALPSVPTSVVLHIATAPRDSNWMTLKLAVLVCS